MQEIRNLSKIPVVINPALWKKLLIKVLNLSIKQKEAAIFCYLKKTLLQWK